MYLQMVLGARGAHGVVRARTAVAGRARAARQPRAARRGRRLGYEPAASHTYRYQ